jgi:catalase
MNPIQRQILFDNTARAVGGAAVHIQESHVANCTKADPEYGAGVAVALRRMRPPVVGASADRRLSA